MKEGTASHEMADLYAPQGVDLGGGGSPSTRNDTVCARMAWQKKVVLRPHNGNISRCTILSLHYNIRPHLVQFRESHKRYEIIYYIYYINDIHKRYIYIYSYAYTCMILYQYIS